MAAADPSVIARVVVDVKVQAETIAVDRDRSVEI